MTEPLLYTAKQAAEALGMSEGTFNRMFADGRIPACIQHPATFGQSHTRRYSRHLLELWAAGALDENAVNIGPLDLTSPARHSPRRRRTCGEPHLPPGVAAPRDLPLRPHWRAGGGPPHPRPAA
jgi:hypothetical protein